MSVRAKVFHHDGDWKERGSGMLKVNVPQACVDFDNSGVPIPGSFDYYEQSPMSNHTKTLGGIDSLLTLPSSWMRDERIFELEKRAIFSRTWLIVSHVTHFDKPGDYVRGASAPYVYDISPPRIRI